MQSIRAETMIVDQNSQRCEQRTSKAIKSAYVRHIHSNKANAIYFVFVHKCHPFHAD